MRRWLIMLVLSAALGVSAVPWADAHDHGNPSGIDECDWASFRNGPRNHGASGCDQIGVTNVATLRPHLLYRTRDSVTSTPAVVDGILYVGAWDGRFYAFDTADPGVGDPSFEGNPVMTVEPLWTFDVADQNRVSFGRIVSSPTVTDIGGKRVVIFAGGATVYALDADPDLADENHRLLAHQCLDPRSDADAPGGRCKGSDIDIEVESSPIVVPNDDGTVSIVIGQDNHNQPNRGRTGVVKMTLTNAAGSWSLDPVWKFDPEARVAYSGSDMLTHLSGTGDGCGGVWGTPAVDAANDVVVFGTSSCNRTPAGGVMDTEDVAGEKVYAVRYSTGEELWRFDPPRPWGSRTDDDFGASLQLFEVGERLVAGAGGKDGWYYALDALSGTLLWSTQMGQSGHATPGLAIGGVLGSPAVGMANGKQAIFVTTAISTPIAKPMDPSPSFRPSSDMIDATLAEDPGRMLSLHALDAETGAILWRSPLTRQTYGHPTYVNGLVLVTSTVGFDVEATHADTGVPLWRSIPLNGAPSSGVAVTNDGIYVGAGTRQTDLGFKLVGDDSVIPDSLQGLIRQTPLVEHLGADPQERASGVWGFKLAP